MSYSRKGLEKKLERIKKRVLTPNSKSELRLDYNPYSSSGRKYRGEFTDEMYAASYGAIGDDLCIDRYSASEFAALLNGFEQGFDFGIAKAIKGEVSKEDVLNAERRLRHVTRD